MHLFLYENHQQLSLGTSLDDLLTVSPNGTLTDIVKQVQTQLISFYVTLVHKDKISKVSFIGGI